MTEDFLAYKVTGACKVEDFTEGRFLLLDKPYTWSSFDIVNKIRILLRHYLGLKKIKVGHAGTLDPLATGLMIICTGKMTKKIDLLMGMDKEYIADITLGGTTPSFDLETEINERFDYAHIRESEIQNALVGFAGVQMQLPPMFSAIRINGKRAYQHARKGEEVALQPRKVTFNELGLIGYTPPVAQVRINCSKGTYIRSFANDLGKALNTGAHLSALKRTKTGSYLLENALTMETFENCLKTITE
ncbi:MAG: tRNA pseudouridine(55) synthase TruB [Cytophagaceae bacterium]|jgi:tRNA pseudouridine55 synthase|nr:tRNA pseudouridine(55) synthase TruB [Cytophagaceae bacterium]